MNIVLNGEEKEFNLPLTVSEIIKTLPDGIQKNAVAVLIDGKAASLNSTVNSPCKIETVSSKEERGMNFYRHTASHVMASAIKTIFPTSKLAGGGETKYGFYYDVDYKTPIKKVDLEVIEHEMKSVIKADFPIENITLPKNEAVSLMKNFHENYIVQEMELLTDKEEFTFIKIGDFIDYCEKPHVFSTGKIKHFKLLSITGAYFQGKASNKMLTRIYGVVFEKKSELEDYVEKEKNFAEKEHAKLGKKLGYFTMSKDIGAGLNVILPNGEICLQKIRRFIEDEEYKHGFMPLKTPTISRTEFFDEFGYIDYFKDKTFKISGFNKNSYSVKTVSCPFHIKAFSSENRSYKELPVKYYETSNHFRNLPKGKAHGLTTTAEFSVTEAHSFISPNQLEKELKDNVLYSVNALKTLGLYENCFFKLLTFNEQKRSKFVGSIKDWNNATLTFSKVLTELNIPFETIVGGIGFLGPKLIVEFSDIYSRVDPLTAIQVDFCLTKKAKAYYTDANGEQKTPYVIHRISLGSYEKILAILLEKNQGQLPFWLTPVQVKVLNVSEKSVAFATRVHERLCDFGIRAKLDLSNDRISKKIRKASLECVPYSVIIGEKEAETNSVSVRVLNETESREYSLDEFTVKVTTEDKLKN